LAPRHIQLQINCSCWAAHQSSPWQVKTTEQRNQDVNDMDTRQRFSPFHTIRSSRYILLFTAILLLATLPYSGTAHSTPPDINPTAKSSLQTRSIQAGNTTWSYYEGAKNGPVLLLVHGFSSSKDAWRTLGEDLGARFHVIIPDLPGWGDSTRLAGESYDIDAQAARLNDFLLALDLREINLVGHSMGGAIAGVFAAQRPERIARLVLVNPLGLSFAENDFVRSLNAGHNPFIYDDRAGVERTARLVYLNPPEMSDQEVENAIAGNRHQRSFIESTLAQIRLPSQWFALDHRLAQLTLPVLGIGCREDKVIDISALQTMQNGLPDDWVGQVVTLEGCNHLPMIERPVATGQLLTDFAAGAQLPETL
jgi:pimeloyl-ACP methyl ester carboxylesterase